MLAWGAVNAMHPTATRKQVEFKLDYSGGYGTYKKDVWKTFKNACRAYDGPELQWFVAGLQGVRRLLLGAPVLAADAAELRPRRDAEAVRLGAAALALERPIAELTVNLNWAYKKYHHVFGSFTYLGRPVHGFKSTPAGVPLDTFGRNLYLDTFDSAYGNGWLRENSFLMHKGTGKFCYGFYSHGSRPEGHGTKYRATIIGPGVVAGHLLGGRRPRRVRQGLRPADARDAEGVPRRRPLCQRRLAARSIRAVTSGEQVESGDAALPVRGGRRRPSMSTATASA